MSDEKVIHLSHHTHDGSRWTVEQMLADALSDVREHRRTPTKALVLLLDEAEGRYDVGFNQSGLSMSQCLALVEVAKTLLLREMGYIA